MTWTICYDLDLPVPASEKIVEEEKFQDNQFAVYVDCNIACCEDVMDGATSVLFLFLSVNLGSN